MTFDEYRIRYWKMFLLLEKELIEASDYVDIATANYATTSRVFSKLLLSIGSEVDNVFREFSEKTGNCNITNYCNFILDNKPEIVNQKVMVKNTSIVLQPYKEWEREHASQSLEFWHKYNKLKHNRIRYAGYGSLETVLTALAALFIIELYRFEDIFFEQENTFASIPEDESKLFVLNSWNQRLRCSKVNLDYSIYDEENGYYDFERLTKEK